MTPAAYAVLNTEAVAHNVAVARRHAPTAKLMAVIKANGYGHGLLRIADALAGVDAFAVARGDEGIRLRNAGFTQPITVLEGFRNGEDLDAFLQQRLDTVVHSFQQLEILETRVETEQLGVWLKIDTGMNRLGFRPADVAGVYQRLRQCRIIAGPIRFMTHLANADDKADPKTPEQIALFNATLEGYAGERSIANSAGVLGWQEALADWVRPGVMLYGISPFPELTRRELGLQPVMGLYSQLIAVKPVRQGETVGYSGTWRCPEATLLGVVAVGYGDGYPRYAKTGTPVLVNGRRVPLIGRVSMDMITVDLASQPDAKPGDPVALWNEALPVEEIAHCADTIPYTLVCGITQRVQIIEREN
ncbi:alanine racemase [Methylomicrobium lacus]|uniref:alanine racemase n=1 Tax=Methylomicrobium lacus TaxID=136992 RepID=UPI0035A86639